MRTKLQKLKNSVLSYYIFSVTEFKQNYLAYKSRLFLWIIANSISILAQIFLWIAVYKYSSTSTINGFEKMDMINYIILSKITEALTFVSLESKISNDLSDGNITMNLIKPINYRFELLFRAFGGVLGSCILFVPIYSVLLLIFNATASTIPFSLGINVLFYIILLLISFLSNYFISIIFSSLVFRTIKSNGVYEIKKTFIKFLSGAIIPISFYPAVLSSIIKFTPFMYFRYAPIAILQNKYSINDSLFIIGISFFWLLILGVLSRLLWNKQIKKITIYEG